MAIALLPSFVDTRRKPAIFGACRVNSKDGIIAAWMMNEGGGASLYDAANGYTAAINSAANVTSATGAFGASAKSFDGSGYATATVGAANNWANQSVVCWIKTSVSNGGATYTRIIEKGANTEWIIDWFQTTSGRIGAVMYDGGATIAIAETLSAMDDGKWHQIVANFSISGSNATAEIYADGVFNATATAAYSHTTTGNISIGQYGGGGGYMFNGLIDHIVIRNRLLSAGEVANLYVKPFSFLRPNRRNWLAKSGSVPAFKPAWAVNRSGILGGGL